MRSVSNQLKTELEEAYSLQARARLIAEWNHNRFTPIQSVDTINKSQGDLAYDPDIYPISSIAEPLRPHRSGLIKARTGASVSTVEGFVAPEYGNPNGKRYYVSSENDYYKYWCSAVPSAIKTGAAPGTGYYFSYSQQPTVMYEYKSLTNKIVIKFENSFASPVKWRIRTTATEGAGWTTIATDLSVPSSGVVTLYRQADGSWNTPLYRDNPIEIDGLNLIVESINKNNSYLQLIEMSARYEAELTNYLVDFSATNTMSETSFLAPIGELSSNEVTIKLDNTTGLFNRENANGIVPGHQRFIDKNVKLMGFIYYDNIPTVGSEGLRIFTSYSDEWAGQGEEIATIQCKDFSVYLQTITPPKVMYQNLSVAEIVWRLCDVIGFTEYNVQLEDRSADQKIPYFWTDGEQSIWEIFSELAEATQTAIYFDELGVLQIKDRGNLTPAVESINWALNYNKVGDKLPEIVDLSTNFDFEANCVKIKYKPTSVKTHNKGIEKTEMVWEPEGTTTLRSSNLTTSLALAEQDRIRISPTEAKVWPYTGLVNINGELIRYNGKGYYWYENSSTQRHSWIQDDADKKKLDDQTPDTLRYKNAFSGALVDLERGVYNTVPASHPVDIGGYYCRFTSFNSTTTKLWSGGWTLDPINGYAQLATNNTFTPNHTYIATRGSSYDKVPTRYGTRIRFPKGKNPVGAGGIVFCAGTNDAGYYVELTRTAYVSKGTRAYHNEVIVYSRRPGGALVRMNKGVVHGINENTWYNLDVFFKIDSADIRHIWVMINGVVILQQAWIPEHSFNNSLGGRFGVFVRGNTTAQFEYLYGVRDSEDPEPYDTTFFDMVNGGFTTKPFAEFTYNYLTGPRPKGIALNHRQRTGQILFDEFAPVVHEVRESEITFDKFPVLHSTPYISNTNQALVTEYNGNPFGAKITVANTSRENAVLHGEDTLTFGTDNPVDQKFIIYGSLVTQDDEKEEVVKNHNAIRVRGEVEVEISSKWIQNDDFAKNLAKWIAGHWSQGNDEVTVTVFGNPMFQLLDRVTINWPDRHMSASTHKYYIVGVRNSWDHGLETTLTLRRAKFTTLSLTKPHYKPMV